MIDSEKFFTYLKNKIPDFEKMHKSGQVLFTCPNIANHRLPGKGPSMTMVPGVDKFYCLRCGVKYTTYDCIRILEEDKKSYSDIQIIEYLTNTMKIDSYPELEEYKKLKWSLVPIAKNGKKPIEEAWTSKTHYEKAEWLKWIDSGLNIGCRTGEVSQITVIDVDLKIPPTPEMETIYQELKKCKTLTQNSPHGTHFIFQYDKELQTSTKIQGVTIDIRNDGGQILVSPSKITGLQYNWANLNTEIKTISESLKIKLISDKKVENSRSTKEVKLETPSEYPKLKGNNLEGCCNDTFIRLGGIFINHFTPADTELILTVFNSQLLEQPMPVTAVQAMVHSLEGYRETEEQTQEKKIYECCKLLQVSIHPKDVRDHTRLDIDIVNKHLSAFNKLGILTRRGRGVYDFKEKVAWVNTLPEEGTAYPHKIPYFNTIMDFEQGDILLIGAPTGKGKSHIAMNIIKQMKEQGVRPYYLSLESGSRYRKIMDQLGLTAEDVYVSKDPIVNPTQIELEPNSFSVIDWLYTGEDFSMTQSIFKYLADEMRRKGGILVVFSQLKEDYSWFAVNLIKSFPALTVRYIYDDSTGVIGHFECDKIRDPLGHNQSARIDCEFDFSTKILTKKEII